MEKFHYDSQMTPATFGRAETASDILRQNRQAQFLLTSAGLEQTTERHPLSYRGLELAGGIAVRASQQTQEIAQELFGATPGQAPHYAYAA